LSERCRPHLYPKFCDGGAYESAKYAERRDDIRRLMLAGIVQARGELASKVSGVAANGTTVRQSLIAVSSADVVLRSLLPDVWIAAHPEHFLQYRRDEAEAAARARKRRREKRWAESKAQLPAG
jgi:hypothetical protein